MPPSPYPDPPAFLQGGGTMGRLIRAFDWASHPLGPPAGWPPALQMSLSLCLGSSFPTAIYWGPEAWLLYNDAWAPIPAERHPQVLGQPAQEVWPDIWHVVGPQLQHVRSTGEGLATYEEMLPMRRGGRVRETWWNYSLTAIRNPDHSIGGIFNQGHEITDIVVARRERMAELQRWRDRLRQAPAAVALLRGPEHRFEFANDAYRALVGDREVVGLTVDEALPEIPAQGYVQLLDEVYRCGQSYVGRDQTVQLQRPDGQVEDRTLDFIFQPTRDGAGEIDGIFVLALDMTARAKAEAALRVTNWQLGEERARLAATVEAEQRARTALRRVSEGLEAQIRQRTAELTRALQQQSAIADRMRATFETTLVYQGFLEPDGILRDANAASLAGIGAPLAAVTGRPLWDTPWFTATPGASQQVQEAVASAARGRTATLQLELDLPAGRHRFAFAVRPASDAAGRVIGLVAEAIALDAGG